VRILDAHGLFEPTDVGPAEPIDQPQEQSTLLSVLSEVRCGIGRAGRSSNQRRIVMPAKKKAAKKPVKKTKKGKK
jgi:hypothetical protein